MATATTDKIVTLGILTEFKRKNDELMAVTYRTLASSYSSEEINEMIKDSKISLYQANTEYKKDSFAVYDKKMYKAKEDLISQEELNPALWDEISGTEFETENIDFSNF